MSSVILCGFSAALLLAQLSLMVLPWQGPSRAYSGPEQDSASEEEVRAIEPGVTVERVIEGGKKHSYRITLAPDQFLRVIVGQREIDVFLRFYGPGGEQIMETRNFLDPARPERLSFVAQSQGDYRLEIIALGMPGAGGSYELRVEPLRAATPEDRSLVAAEKLYSEAERLHAEGRLESRRQAMSKYQESLPHFRQSGDRRGEADAIQFIALAHVMSGESEKAIGSFFQALPLYRAAGDRRGESQCLLGLGLVNHLSGELHRALEYYEQSLPLNRELNDKVGEAGTLNNIGGVYHYMGEHQKALEYYRPALLLQQELKNIKGEAVTLNNIGEIYRILGEYQRALEYFERSLPLRREVKDRRGEAVALNNIGLTCSSLGEHEKALEYYYRSLALRREVGDRFGEASTLHNIGFSCFKLGQRDRALESFNRALELRRAVSDRRGEARTLHLLGVVYSSRGEIEKAMEHFNRALPLSRAAFDRTMEAATLYSIARMERDRGNLAQARDRMDAALDIIEGLRSRVAGQELRETFLASKQDHYQLYIDVLMRLQDERPTAGFDAKAFEASERARARTLLDVLAEARAEIREGVDSALLERERALQQQINSKEALRVETANRRNGEKQAQAMEDALEKLLNRLREVRAQIRASSPRYASLVEPQPSSLEEIQRSVLDEESLLLEYSLGEERSYLWAVSGSAISSYALPPRARIEAAARRVYESLTARNARRPGEDNRRRQARIAQADRDFPEAARLLSEMVLGPVREKIRAKRLVVVSEGALQYVPFGALPMPATGGRLQYRPLIADHEIVNLPSSSALALIRRDSNGRKPAPRLVAVLADPVFSSDDPRLSLSRLKRVSNPQERNHATADESIAPSVFRRLRFSRREADAIASMVPADKRLKAIDFAANRAMATSRELSEYRILHFSTHGVLDSQNPELSGVVLSLVDEHGRQRDGFLRLHEIYNLRLNADLVVLSACRTALGKEVRGEGLVGLTRGFMYAGAPRVVASLWNVEDKATAELMKLFYEAMLSRGMTAAAALRSAQVEMWQAGPSQSPYFWAGFILQGEWK